MLPAVQTILPQDPYHSVFKILVVQRRGVFLREVDLSGLINNRLNLFSSRFRTVPYAFKYHWDFPLSGNLYFTNLSYKAMLFVNLLSSFSLTPRCLVWNCDENRMTRFLPRSYLFITTISITNIIVIVICQLLFYPEGIIFLSFLKKTATLITAKRTSGHKTSKSQYEQRNKCN